jgi:erythronate-4-phosphate dehydrogenase
MRIVADPNIPFVREAFGSLGDIALVPGREITAATVRDADALLVRSVTRVNESLLAGSRVKFVATATIGTDHVDERYLALRGIGFASAAGSNANSVAEYVVAAMLELAHRRKFRLRDKTLGVVGVGNVGSRVVRYAEALGMRVLQNDPPRERAEFPASFTDELPDTPTPGPSGAGEFDSAVPLPGGVRGGFRSPFVSLDRVLAEADIITLHVPLTREGPDATFHLFDKDRLAALELRRPILINTARGAVIDNKALLKAIDGEKIGATVLDVWENEPNISPELLDVVDLGTPHIAGYSLEGKVNGTRMIYEAACRHFGWPATWQPVLPPPPAIELTGDLYADVRRMYDITADDAALRKNVRDFDKLRAEYPVRREFHIYGFRL